jgi:hypothetical protein
MQPPLPPWERQGTGIRRPETAPDPWTGRAGRGFDLAGSAGVGPLVSGVASRAEGIARLAANPEGRNLSKPPDLGKLGTKLAQKPVGSGGGTGAVPFPGATEEELLERFPGAAREQAQELIRLQTMNAELLRQLQQRRRDLSRKSKNYLGETVLPDAAGNPRTVLKGDTWKIEFHDGSSPIHVVCDAKENVHIRSCRGLDQPVHIYIEGIAGLVYIEDCANMYVVTECVLFGMAACRSVNLDLIVASEVPDISIRDSKGCELTLCPDNMDGGVETMRSGNVSLHCVFRKGIVALEPEDLIRHARRVHVHVCINPRTRAPAQHIWHRLLDWSKLGQSHLLLTYQ